MTKTRIVRVALHALAASIVGTAAVAAPRPATTAAAPMAVQADPAATFAATLKPVIEGAAATAQSSGQTSEEAIAAIQTAIQQAILTAALDPAVVLDALGQTTATLTSEGKMTPEIQAALAAVVTQIRALIENPTGATGGGTGGTPVGAGNTAGASGGGGGYRPST